MTYEEKNITVSLACHSLIAVYFVAGIFQMLQSGGLNPAGVFTIWVVAIATVIIVNITVNILTNILLAILHAIKTGGREEERFVSDERDALIGLKGMRVEYVTFAIGVFLAMVSFVIGQHGLAMFAIIAFSSILAEIVGDIARLALYRKAG